jgi:cold shock CspA family protein/GTPase SAR1 family protein
VLELDEAAAKFEEIAGDIEGNIEKITSEEDSKIQIINRVFNECLGWPYKDFKAETKHENGFSDYILFSENNPSLLIEAKRVGILDIQTAQQDVVRYLKISGSALKKCMSGIEQATSYAAPNGLPVAVLTDGFKWIVFKTFVPGTNYKSNQAIVFPSLNAIKSSFGIFYELLSKNNFSKRVYNPIFDDIHNKRLLLSNKLVAPINSTDIKISKQSDLSFDLRKIFTNFFSQLTGDDNDELMIECFVESHESRIADYSLEKITTSVLANISGSRGNVDTALSALISDNLETENQSEQDQSVFIVGPTGSGKTTFLERFFDKTLSKTVSDHCLVLNINCLSATGGGDTVVNWMINKLIKILENELYDDGCPCWNDLQGLYHSQYVRKARGVDAILYKRDKNAFKEKFGKFLDDTVENDREGYLYRILHDVVSNRKMLPIVVVDNTDEFSLEFKTKLFQLTNSLKREIKHCMLIFPVTDKSAWTFSKTDIFSIYQSKSFFLPTPSPREVLRKRIDFLGEKLKINPQTGDKKEYFLSKGIRISIEHITGFAKVIEDIFVNHDYTSKTLGEMTNYNIRRTLLLSQRVITSSAFNIDDLIKSYISGELVTTNYTKFIDALVRGNYEIYKFGDTPEVCPIYQVDTKIVQSPLLQLRILALLKSAQQASRNVEEKHLTVQSIIDYFDAIGVSEASVDKALDMMIEAGLIEPYDLSAFDLSITQKLAISYKGTAHLNLGSKNNVFFYQMALTTAISDSDTAFKIKDTYNSKLLFQEKLIKIKTLFYNYLIQEDEKYISNVPVQHDQYSCQVELLNNLKGFCQNKNGLNNDLSNTLGDSYKEGPIKDDVIAIVDFYDPKKHFGFAIADGFEDKFFFRKSQLQELGIKTVDEGDSILCDLSRGPRGIYIEKIHKVTVNINDVKSVSCRVTRYFHQRAYGFCKFGSMQKDAWFHKTVFPESFGDDIAEGVSFNAEVIEKKDNYYQVRKVLEILPREVQIS